MSDIAIIDVKGCDQSRSDDIKPPPDEQPRCFDAGVEITTKGLHVDEEMPIKINKTSTFFNKLNRLLTGGTSEGILLDDLCIFVMLSPVETPMDPAFLNNIMSFIKNLEPNVLFDFDLNGFAQGIYHTLDTSGGKMFNVYTLDMFDDSKEDFKYLPDMLQKDNYTQWVFCNGHDKMESFDKRISNKTRKLQFQEAMLQLTKIYGTERILFVMCLLSNNYEIMISACEEAITRLPNQWILLAEHKDIAKLWLDKISENKFKKQELENKCVLDMSWDQISIAVSQLNETNKNTDVYLPSSCEPITSVPIKQLKDWYDIDILTAGDFVLEGNNVNQLEKKVEAEFYRGKQVCWLNFWFQNQVLQRDIHSNLKKRVEDALEGKSHDKCCVQYVTLWHQPGAGGTTAAMNVLWELRREYRCCRVLNITEETAVHLEEVWHFSEDSIGRSPKPLLVLVDYVDDDQYIQFKNKLEVLGQMNSIHFEESFDVFCTIIECHRNTFPIEDSNKLQLLHTLSDRELRWFDEKNKQTNYRINLCDYFAFNIMQNNFSLDCIPVIEQMCNDICDKWERKLLLIVSFLNVYDLAFRPVKVSWLDFMFKNRNVSRVEKTTVFTREVKWEAMLSSSIKVLMNISNYSRKSLRIINKRVAKEVLKYMLLRTGTKRSQIMIELCDQIYHQTGQQANNFRHLIQCVAMKIEVGETGIKNKYSPFVLDVIKKEDYDVSADVLIKLFEVSQDPFIAQIIAKLYTDKGNWEKAEYFAFRATLMNPGNSCLWDTYGRVFSSQLTDYTKVIQTKFGPVDSNVIAAVKIAFEALEKFKKAQETSEYKTANIEVFNTASYFGELVTIRQVLNVIKLHSAFRELSKLHKYLVDLNYCPDDLCFLQDYKFFLKSLVFRATQGIRRLDEEYFQLKRESSQEKRIKVDLSRDNLIKLKSDLDYYFDITKITTEPKLVREACTYRLRVAQSKGASSLSQTLELRKNGKSQDLIDCARLLVINVKSPSATFYDFKALLDVLTVLIVGVETPPGLTFEHLLGWCKKFYYHEQPKESTRRFLEPVMYFVMYNFPTEERVTFNLCTVEVLKNAMVEWGNTFKNNYPYLDIGLSMLRKSATTLFFLGNGQPLQDIIHLDHIEIINYKHTRNLYEIRKRLRMMTGVLLEGGEKVKTCLPTKNGKPIALEILTAYPVYKKNMWSRSVYFYLGFSFSGPKAFGISLEELETGRN
ncbi:sterile alpha motif domain-containing protein 9-like [Physella acuta]|uniref:sterile alpha motif domain-containing protein 9-like n=1 Tax=Physella acuta TaxID=109671 RepID=UPI0027DD658F|nr:sterile alpha motif domain-containing protein 9-like [Physella acuta]